MEEIKPLGYLLNRSLRVFKNQVSAYFRLNTIDLSFEQYVILHMINSKCDLIQQDLANFLHRDKSIIVRQIDGLIEKAYVIRQPNTSDKRKKNLVLTPEGLAKLNQMTKMAFEVSEKLLDGITDEEYAVFRKVLNKVQENGNAAEEFLTENQQQKGNNK